MNHRFYSYFDIDNLRYYAGPNPYLNCKAIAFDFVAQEDSVSISWSHYQREIDQYISGFNAREFASYGDLFAQTVLAITKRNLELHLHKSSVITKEQGYLIAIESLHHQTLQEIIYLAKDWLEAIAHDQYFDFYHRLNEVQEIFSRSPYGGATGYALCKAAYLKRIPFFYLPEERLIQYGYGKNQVRGVGTTFDVDSHLDSDFTTQKDDCKNFIANCGFPIPRGEVVYSEKEAIVTAESIGYPVAVKPVSGHKGIGVTANIQAEKDLLFAFRQINPDSDHHRIPIIVEKNISGGDFRLLCVGGKFVAALERRPPCVVGDGKSTIAELIDKQNSVPIRQDTPTSPLTKIRPDQKMDYYLTQQELSFQSIPKVGEFIYLSQVANISAGGVSINVTDKVHPDNQQLATAIAQYFRLVCLGIDVITEDISKSWQESELAILEINAAPGVFMHLYPAIGKSVDVPSQIMSYFFPSTEKSLIPIITCNRLEQKSLLQYIDTIKSFHPHWIIGGICFQGVWLNHHQQTLHSDYNLNVEILLRHPQLDCLIVEYCEDNFVSQGTFYQATNLVILDNPTNIEKILARDLLPQGILIIKQENEILIKKPESEQKLYLDDSMDFDDICSQQISLLFDGSSNY